VIYSACYENPGVLNLISNYDLYKGSDFWLGTQAPGYLLFYVLIAKFLILVFPKISICFSAVSLFGNAFFPIFVFLSAILIIKIGLKIGLKNSTLSALFFLIIPNIVFYSLVADQFLYPFIFLMIVWISIQSEKWWTGLFAGVLLYLALFISFKMIPAVAFFVFWIFAVFFFKIRFRKNVIAFGLNVILGFCLIYILFLVTLHYDPVTRYQNAFASNALVDMNYKYNAMGGRTLINQISVLFLNNFELMVWSGTLPFIIFLYEGIRGGIKIFQKNINLPNLFFSILFGVYLILCLSGKVVGETSRLWMFFCPIFSISTVNYIQRKKNSTFLLLFFAGLQLINLLIFFINFS